MPLLQIKQVRKSFPRGGATQDVIRINHFEMDAAGELGIAGESGSGKSTFLNLIAGVLPPDSGSIVVAGEDITALREAARDRWRAMNIGYIYQTFNLLNGFSCLENVLLAMSFGPGADRARAEGLLHRVGLGDRLNDRPARLSWGQQQRVAVARALANRPKLVLADEPTGNLDSQNATEVVSLIRETCRDAGAALLIVSHDRDVLARFPHVQSMAEINDGGRKL